MNVLDSGIPEPQKNVGFPGDDCTSRLNIWMKELRGVPTLTPQHHRCSRQATRQRNLLVAARQLAMINDKHPQNLTKIFWWTVDSPFTLPSQIIERKDLLNPDTTKTQKTRRHNLHNSDQSLSSTSIFLVGHEILPDQTQKWRWGRSLFGSV